MFNWRNLEYQFWVTPNSYGFQLFWRLLELDACCCCWCCDNSNIYWRWISAMRWRSFKLTFGILFLDEAAELMVSKKKKKKKKGIDCLFVSMRTHRKLTIWTINLWMIQSTKSTAYMISFRVDVPFVIDTCKVDWTALNGLHLQLLQLLNYHRSSLADLRSKCQHWIFYSNC